MRINQQDQIQWYKGDVTEYEIGGKVGCFTPAAKKGERRKASTTWTGPWIITENIPPIFSRWGLYMNATWTL